MLKGHLLSVSATVERMSVKGTGAPCYCQYDAISPQVFNKTKPKKLSVSVKRKSSPLLLGGCDTHVNVQEEKCFQFLLREHSKLTSVEEKMCSRFVLRKCGNTQAHKCVKGEITPPPPPHTHTHTPQHLFFHEGIISTQALKGRFLSVCTKKRINTQV